MVSHRLTVAGALESSTRTLAAAGIASPRREAIRLLADLLDTTTAGLLLDLDRVVEPERRLWIDRAVERRAAGEPLAYVTGVVGFRRLELRIDRRALIPRPETEGLVERVLANRPTGVVVDVGTGSGAIALALADEGHYRTVVALDRSAEALALARHNARACELELRLVRGDLVGGLGTEVADVVVSNPPYVSAGEYAGLDRSVRDFEPIEALVSGPDGLDATRSILGEALRVLRPGGLIALEIASDRAAVAARIAMANGWTQVAVEADLFGRPRYLLGRKGETR